MSDPEVYWIKVVPDDQPNADGEWVKTSQDSSVPIGLWSEVEGQMTAFIPKGHHMVQIAKSPDLAPPGGEPYGAEVLPERVNIPLPWESKPWGFISAEGNFVNIPKGPCIAAGHTKPPFVVDTAFGPRNIIEEPDHESG